LYIIFSISFIALFCGEEFEKTKFEFYLSLLATICSEDIKKAVSQSNALQRIVIHRCCNVNPIDFQNFSIGSMHLSFSFQKE
jgi:hypothetical protein